MNRSLQELINKGLDLAELTSLVKSEAKESAAKAFVVLPSDINIETGFPYVKIVPLKNSKHKILFLTTGHDGTISFSCSNKPDEVFWIHSIEEFLQPTTNH